MRWFMALLWVSGASYLTYSATTRFGGPSPAVSPPASPAVANEPAFSSPSSASAGVLGPGELARVRRSLRDRDPAVRAAAVELLSAVRDTFLLDSLADIIEEDPDSEVRRRSLRAMQTGGTAVMVGLLRGLKDYETSVRLASLTALGDLGDPSAAPFVARAAIDDPNPEVRGAALRVLGKFQAKKDREFRALAEQLRLDYERALRKRRN
jgi:HEAT repeat protein